ncbi:hypothetical protein EXS56_02560 [Candidatus Kaiserbacteria bacterium]|nr:hypothetical protein [Candidatus Kaiserbacteria bacterium]
MSNILPREAKRRVWRMYRIRFMVAGSFVGLLASSLCALSLLPSYLALHASDTARSASSTPQSVANDTDRAAILSIQTMLKVLSPVIATSTPTSVIIQALSLRPSGITVDHITYSAGHPGMIILTGSTATREAINGYRQVLSADSHWKTVSVPIGDLTGEPGARFSITLSGAF